MLNRDNREQKSPAKRFLLILGLLMFAFYFILGMYIVFWDDFPLQMDKIYRILFGVLLIVYSFIRFVRLIQIKKD